MQYQDILYGGFKENNLVLWMLVHFLINSVNNNNNNNIAFFPKQVGVAFLINSVKVREIWHKTKLRPPAFLEQEYLNFI